MSIVSTSIRLYAWQTNYETLNVVQGEAISRSVQVQLYDQSEPIDVSGDIINLYGTKPDGTVLYISSQIVDAANGIIDIVLTSQFAAVAGEVPCFIQVIRPGSMDLRFSGLTIKVESCEIDEALESSNDFSALQVLLGNLAELENNVEQIVADALGSYLMKSVYDPQNKATDIFQEIANRYTDARNMDNANEGTLAIARGGTGATSAENALVSLGAAPAAHNHAAGDINSGTLPISRGGTGQTSAQAIRNALGLGDTTGALPVANGGTGSTDAASARSALGITLANLGAAASTHNHSASDINSGTLPISRGGTGGTTQATALTALGIVYSETEPTVVNGTYWFQPNE